MPSTTMTTTACTWALRLALVLALALAAPGGSAAAPAGVIEFELSGVVWQQLYDHNTGRYYFSDTSNAHTQWEDPRTAGHAAGGSGLVASLVLAPLAFLGVCMFVRVMYLQVYHPEYLYPRRFRRHHRKKGAAKPKVCALLSRRPPLCRCVLTPTKREHTDARPIFPPPISPPKKTSFALKPLSPKSTKIAARSQKSKTGKGAGRRTTRS
jgi:hypothetical protein